jgi:GT2 family glycosyltransferase
LRASVVVLCYNSLEEATRPCLESIIKNTPSDEYELIIIDNCSSDGTPEYLSEFAKGNRNIRLKLNGINKGYAGGNNDGIKLATGDFIVLLNNDTLVPPGWLERLLKPFLKDSKIGLVGPVTNSAGNEQRIDLPKLNEKNYEEISAEYIKRHCGVIFKTDRLGFFCVAITRTALDEIGLLDEGFGIGMFEDDDYCIRAKKAKFTLAITEDCFVYHKGSISFQKLTVENYRKLFEKNREYFNSKHDANWLFSDITSSLWIYIANNLINTNRNSQNITGSEERILVRINNMHDAIYQNKMQEISNNQKLPDANKIRNSKIYRLLKIADIFRK